MGPSEINVPVYLFSFDPATNNFNSDTRHVIRSIISNSVVKFKSKFSVPSLLPFNIKLLKNYIANVFTKVHKGRYIVILN